MQDAYWIARCANQLRRRWSSLDATESAAIATQLALGEGGLDPPETAANRYAERRAPFSISNQREPRSRPESNDVGAHLGAHGLQANTGIQRSRGL